jgi:hypothetical protein
LARTSLGLHIGPRASRPQLSGYIGRAAGTAAVRAIFGQISV